jgi:hypothetical protein
VGHLGGGTYPKFCVCGLIAVLVLVRLPEGAGRSQGNVSREAFEPTGLTFLKIPKCHQARSAGNEVDVFRSAHSQSEGSAPRVVCMIRTSSRRCESASPRPRVGSGLISKFQIPW